MITLFFFLNLRTDKLACILFGQSKYDSANIHYNLLFRISILLTELDPSTSYTKCLTEKENLLYRIMYILYVSICAITGFKNLLHKVLHFYFFYANTYP